MKRACWVLHRRAGKDKTLINVVAKKMLERVGAYYYFFPEFNQGRRILWDGMDKDGFKFMDHIPVELRKSTNNQEMKIELKNGSIFQIVGTDNYHAVRGTNPVGCVFSEYALQNPMAWDVVRPILNENGGWAIFNFTPLGKNHGFQLYESARHNPNWFCELLTVKDTKREDGRAVITKEAIDEERTTGMTEDLIQQEYYCSFDASIKGAYFSDMIKAAREEGRIAPVEFDRDLPVDTGWDLGRNDCNSIWFPQCYGRMIRFIDFDQRSGESMKFYVNLLYEKHKQKGYKYGTHYLPHDINVTDYSAEQSRRAIFEETYKTLFGKSPDIKIVPAANPLARIEAVRHLFPRFQFDDANEKVRFGVDALSQYRKEYDEKNRVFKSSPLHDWTSHCADGLGTFAMGYEEKFFPQRTVGRQQYVGTNSNTRDPYEV